ncbi:MAG: glycosyl hydrolase [Chlorobi bacterium]|nr:glycosyl hydrolase [Chlorobiota bacterium]
MKKIILFTALFLAFLLTSITAQNEKSLLKETKLSGLKFRSIGPAITGGRIIDIAVNPFDKSEYYVAAGHGSLWKTANGGVTFKPVFDHEKSYAIGAVEIDPKNPNVVWVGTGENNNQNNVIYGDGVYKSEDGGKSWKNMGLKESEHIGGIAIDPKNPNVVFVAAYGSLRRGGGDRGIFKTTDGGETWKNTLRVSDFTGCFEIHIDPRYSNILYAVAHQRMRKHYTGVYGGPESGIYRSIDGGETWEKTTEGLPKDKVGRIGLAISPVNPDVIYASVESDKENKGIYRSVDRGASWEKRSGYISAYPFYFQKIFCDPKEVNRVYSMDVFMKVSEDGGKTWKNAGEKHKHVDNHVLWIDPDNNNHLLSGCDGGLYESFDRAKNWLFHDNIPIAEIYKITADNSKPFYYVYIGTQDNNSLGGPSRTISSGGITNQDWFFTWAGDGFGSQVDWKNPNVVYAQSQYGGLARYDRITGEKLFIKPYEFIDTAYRFDWDSPLLISKFDNKRLYMGANKLLRTTDMGSSWEEISPDLTRGVPKEMEKLMGKSWSVDDLARKSSTAQIVSIAESPLDENILFVGSGDGLIHFTKDGGKTWNEAKEIPNLPKYARVHQIVASLFDKKTAYASCDDFIGGDYKPYAYKTTDGGETWFSINGDLPEKGSVYTIAEDGEKENLLFVGTQFGVYFTVDGGKKWLPLKNGIPNACAMDMTIQREENDLVVATFGRGVFILDDYTPLRSLTKDVLEKEAYIFPIKDALMFIESAPFGFSGIGFMGANFYSAKNPKVGATFTYYIKNEYKTLKEKRQDEEKKKKENGEEIKFPSYKRLQKESEEQKPYLLFVVSNENGDVVRKIKTDPKKGINRIVWDFRYDNFSPVSLKAPDNSIPWNDADQGYMVTPGKYFVSLQKFEGGEFTELVPKQSFVCKPLFEGKLTAEEKAELKEFNKKTAELTRALSGADAYRSGLNDKIAYLKKAFKVSAGVPEKTYKDILKAEKDLRELNKLINGDNLRRKYEGAAPTSLKSRMQMITSSLWSATSAPTETYKKSFDLVANKFDEVLSELKKIDGEIKSIESVLEENGAPFTPGRFPKLRKIK